MSEQNEKYQQFMADHRELLECYAMVENPLFYKLMKPAEQRDFCYVQRVKIEDQLMKGKMRPEDFWAQV